MSELHERRVLLGVTGGIAAYKSPWIVRRLAERGVEVRVVMTAGARRFVTPLTFQAVSGHPVRSDLWDESAEAAMGHIELARWAELVLVAPASADFMARLTAGLADDLLSTLCLATEAPLLLAPAMNRVMWSAPATQANRETLAARGVGLLGPASGDQACGEQGAGRMLEPAEIVGAVAARLARSADLAGRHVMVTAGPTRERLDPVRYLTNRSSGKMGFAVAEAAAAAGARVTLVAGPVHLATPAGVERIDVESALQMHHAVHRHIGGVDIFVGAAAVSDYAPASASPHKIKKTESQLALSLDKTPDVLETVAALPQPPFTVGFAAETHRVEDYAAQKMARKKLDMIAANLVGDDCRSGAALGFDCDDNALTVLWPGGRRELPRGPKALLAARLVALIAERQAAGGTPCAKSS